MYYNNILETIGNTPLVKLNKITYGLPGTILAKVETFNPGHSIKDRMALKMVEVAENEGKLKPGGTIIECTSGNTGMGLALVASVKGYKAIFTTSDKQSKEKMDMLKAMGAEVIVCPTNVEPTDSRSYYSVAQRLSNEIPNSFWFNQYDNLANTQAHYETTGPEIWEQTEGKITKLIVGVGTGGTVSGTAKFLKEKNPNIEIIGIDTYGSVFKKYKETGIFDEKEIFPYITEGIGEDILPQNVNFDLIDKFEKVTDKDGALMARRLAKEEGLLLGYSAGSAMAGLLQIKNTLKDEDVVVIIFHDHGSRYVAKIFNDDWMRDRGFIQSELKLSDLIRKKKDSGLITVAKNSKLNDAFKLMKENDFSQMVVTDEDKIVGSVTETDIIGSILTNPDNISTVSVGEVMQDPFPIVDESLPVKALSNYISKQIPAVITVDSTGQHHILTQYDIIQNLA
ncbi:MAG TPA: pyridoxal-phosphate dependent enzyme [Saprospiraceae bacterium]|nr:pyridoxal-phosphate dependent enzyme [Saprospiraceae bacterium]HQU96384.1 pyridoxal-phosphate dependent enzyme [Saprospiraceae bacterium]